VARPIRRGRRAGPPPVGSASSLQTIRTSVRQHLNQVNKLDETSVSRAVSREGRRNFLRTLLATGVGAVTGGAGYGFFYARHAIEMTRVDVPVAGLPPSLGGLRVGLLTDVHRSRWVSAEDVRHAVSLLMGDKPDLIVLGGDYVTWGDRRFVEASAEALGLLSAPLGVFGILGNHDDDHDMPAALSARGVHMLKDTRTRLAIGAEHLDLVGIRFWTKKAADIALAMSGAEGTVVLLAHDPRRLTEALALKIPLVLSGHTHGGQIVLPVIGAVAAHSFPIVAGVARSAGTTIFVSRGVGTVYVPVRINCPPEVAVLTLRSAQA
jgi:predicted MPP superfamily phosphohydrolase